MSMKCFWWLSIPSFRGFSLFPLSNRINDTIIMILSIPSFRGFSLFRVGENRCNGGAVRNFQSPVLGVFLCFLTIITLSCLLVDFFQSPVLGVFLCFLFQSFSGRRLGSLSFQSPVLGVFLCFWELACKMGYWNIELSIPSFRGFSLFPFRLMEENIRKAVFQSPVLGVFLCFVSLERRRPRRLECLSIPSFRGFSLFQIVLWLVKLMR